MSALSTSLRIARAEWTRHRRERGTPLTGHPVLLVVLVGTAIGLGWLAYSMGRTVASGQPLPYDRVSLVASGAFVWMAWRSSEYTHVRFERLEPDLLLTAVPTRTVALGLLGFVYARLLTTLVVPTLGLAVGTAVGLGSFTVAATIGVAVAGLAVLAVALGTTGRLVGRLVALRLVRVRFYRDLLIVFGWIPLLVGAMIFQDLSIALAPVSALFGAVPLAWFVDLALVGASGSVSGRNALGALGLLAVAVPVLTAVTARLARVLWERAPTSATGTRGSYSLLETGVLERVVGARVPRAVYTVARERWLMERRVPRGLLSTGYVLVVMGVFGFPVALFFGEPSTLLVTFAVTLGLVAGIAFGSDPIGTEYRALPMVLTSVTAPQFVAGGLLAATVVGAPLVAVIVIPLGVIGPVGTVQTVLTALLGCAVCVCTAAVALAVGLSVERGEYVPLPFFFTDVPIYAEQGLHPFVRYGRILAVVVLASVPAFAGTVSSLYGPITAFGVPVVLVQTGSLLLTILVVAVVAWIATTTAIERFETYYIQ